MRPVFQTKYGNVEGNCFMACVASILEIELVACPDLHELTNGYAPGSSWWQVAQEWLYQEHDVQLIGLGPNDNGLLKPPQGWSIVSGLSPHGTMHACVALNGSIQHDPHPTGLGILEITDIAVLLPLCRHALRGKPWSEQLREAGAAGAAATS